MKKNYTTPSIDIIELYSDSVITISGFKTSENGGSLKFTADGINTIDF